MRDFKQVNETVKFISKHYNITKEDAGAVLALVGNLSNVTKELVIKYLSLPKRMEPYEKSGQALVRR